MISVEPLTKCYGDFMAVDDLSFEIEEGQVYGFLGPNGAGKSTTMNIMTGCLSATKGHVKIDGYDIFEEPGEAKKRIGYLPEQPPLYMNETPVEYLRFVGEAKGLRGAELERQVAEVVEQTKIQEVTYCADDVYFTQQDGETVPLDTARVDSYLQAIGELDLSNYMTYCGIGKCFPRILPTSIRWILRSRVKPIPSRPTETRMTEPILSERKKSTLRGSGMPWRRSAQTALPMSSPSRKKKSA